jgi:hypothetical protein
MKKFFSSRPLFWELFRRFAIVCISCCVLVPALVECAPSRTNPAEHNLLQAATGANVYHMKLVRIIDQRGFGQPMTAMTMLIPNDWQFQSNVQYGDGVGCHPNLVRLTFRATSPDGRLAIELFPGSAWQWSDDSYAVNMMRNLNQQTAQYNVHGCDLMPPLSADSYLRQVVLPSARRGARVTGSEVMPDAAYQLQQEVSQSRQIAARYGVYWNFRADVGRVRASYMMYGQPVEEWFTAMTSSTAVPGPNGRMGQTLYYNNAADHVFGMRAPQGQLDAEEKFFNMILSTVRMDPQWEGNVRQVLANMAAKDAQSEAERSAIIAMAGQAEANSIHSSYEYATKSREHSMEGWSQYMRGVQSFRNPNSGDTVELSNMYGNAWAGPNDKYILSDSPNYNPNSSQQGNWTRLEAVTR